MIDVDGVAFDEAIEYFAFPLFHRIADMDELAKLARFPRLTSASFPGTELDDRGLAHVCAAMAIDNLNLQETRVTDDGFAHLARLSRLRHLRLKDNRQLTNACIPHLLGLAALENLQIHETSIDQGGLARLVALPNLRDVCLYVCDGNFTFDALLALSIRMPQCTLLAKGQGQFHAGVFHGAWRP